ncbi:hypothetical protein KUTeg_018494 [Tegillarca granosa]|uniref:DDE Tnp4 domain-containing protein n=2 Tax=Tegillarca granosa TaxID=220873 RepID=A0ABQ9EI31_TEGGR|nr:hypothetical protein KUTeg_018494 [Tegillarca granosa]
MASKKQCMIKTILTQFLSSSSDDSSDNDVEYAISIWMMTKSRISVQYLLESITEICISENISGILCRHSSGGSEQIPLHNRILILIWYMASLDKYSSIADRFGVSESTASCAIRNLLQFIQENLVKKVIIWPTGDELQEIQDLYMELKGFPGVVGMIDGSHIRIHKPQIRGIDYYNRKEYYSIVLQAVVREDMRFTDVFTGFPGKVHDARILKESPLYNMAKNMDRNFHILGDSAYPNLPWLLVPFRDNGHLTYAQKTFNKTHSSIRSNVERAFGQLKGRFTRLQSVNQRDIRTIVQTILTGCVLHNICIINHDDMDDMLNCDERLFK